ncbi:YceH family protein [Luteimonas aquatica]|uniref:YceH family protein n=1 Tax=Luteimonas aquatica TaxID=450364 RepID=UPI001F591C51|nr:YceH family protein [Luteimonas aquatica]
MSTEIPLPEVPAPLSGIEARILGCLIEKEATTPEAYPLTANSLLLACNQKNNREPVMELEPGAVGHALREMEDKRLVRSEHGARADRYEHRFTQAYSVTAQQQAILSVMLLRGPQTVVELLTRCERLAKFQGAEEIRAVLERLMQRTPALVVNLGRAAGQREDRYMHLLAGPVSAEQFASARPAPARERTSLESRLDALEATVEALRQELDALRGRID